MKLFKKTAMCVALSATMIGGLLATQTANALPTPSKRHGKSYVNPNRLGQVLIFPYYSVRKGLDVQDDGFKSFFNITNTSADTLALRVRFHEGQNSRDVLDFTVVLSAYDVWTGWVEEPGVGVDSVPRLFSNDNSCTPGATNLKPADGGQPFSDLSYSAPFEDLGPDTIDRAREGYLEVIVMGKVPGFVFGEENSPYNENVPGTVAFNAKHNNAGIPANCVDVNNAFAVGSGNTGPVPTPDSQPVPYPFQDDFNDILGDGDPEAQIQFRALRGKDNPLKGNFSIINGGEGIGAGNGAVAISRFMRLGKGSSGQDGSNLITAQGFPYSLEPTIASGKGIWTVNGLERFEEAINSKSVTNEWGNNPDSGAHLDWAITFPSKAFHVDYTADDDNIYAALNQWRRYIEDGEDSVSSKEELVGEVFEDNATADGAAVSVALTGWDREEAEVGNPFPSPDGGSKGPVLLGETNIITFADSAALNKSALSSKQFNLNYDIAAALKAAGKNLDAKNGWAKLGFLYTGSQKFPIYTPIIGTISFAGCVLPFGEPDPALCLITGTVEDPNAVIGFDMSYGFRTLAAENTGFPVVGWAYKTRNQGDPTLSYSQILPHSWGKNRDFGESDTVYEEFDND